jgi:hypothetical protein
MPASSWSIGSARSHGWSNIWQRSRCVESLKSRLAFVLCSKLYRQMYANTGIAADSARVERSTQWARWIAKPCRRLFSGSPCRTWRSRPERPATRSCILRTSRELSQLSPP